VAGQPAVKGLEGFRPAIKASNCSSVAYDLKLTGSLPRINMSRYMINIYETQNRNQK